MDQSRFIPFPQLHVQNSKALWDFGSYPERKDNDGLLFEKEVLDIQVGKGSKSFVFTVFKNANLHSHGQLCGIFIFSCSTLHPTWGPFFHPSNPLSYDICLRQRFRL